MSLPALRAQVIATCLRRVRLALESAHKGPDRQRIEARDAFDAALRDIPTGSLTEGATLAEMGLDCKTCRILSEANLFTVADLRRQGYARLQSDFGYRLASRVKFALATFGVSLSRDGSRNP